MSVTMKSIPSSTPMPYSLSHLLVFWRNKLHLRCCRVSQASTEQYLLVASSAVSQPSAADTGSSNQAISCSCSKNVKLPC
jgi:hypothetical protein